RTRARRPPLGAHAFTTRRPRTRPMTPRPLRPMPHLPPVLLAAALLAAAPHAQTVIHVDAGGTVLYVDADAAPGGDGASWASAFHDLQDALAVAQAGDEVWIAEGVYRPTEGGDREATFALASGVALYGGFDGTETHRDERDWTVHASVLSGDIGVPGDSTDNAYHVVTASGVDRTALLDGLTVRHGMGRGGDPPHNRGAGLYAPGGSPTVRNCLIARHAIGRPAGGEKLGGGAYFEDGSPLVEDTVFEHNSANAGGGLYASGGAPVLRRVTFRSNGGAGALAFWGGSAGVVEDALFEHNTRNAVFVVTSDPVFRRATFRDNVPSLAGVTGAGALIRGGSPVFEDCLFERLRTAIDLDLQGGGVYVTEGDGGEPARPAFVRTTF